MAMTRVFCRHREHDISHLSVSVMLGVQPVMKPIPTCLTPSRLLQELLSADLNEEFHRPPLAALTALGNPDIAHNGIAYRDLGEANLQRPLFHRMCGNTAAERVGFDALRP